MAQTLDQYSIGQPLGFPGALADLGSSYKIARKNASGKDLPFGIAVKQGSTADTFAEVDENSPVLGILVHHHTADRSLTGDAGVAKTDVADVLARGSVYVRVEQAVSPNDPVYVRFAGEGVKGAFRKDADLDGETPQARVVYGARYMTSADEDGIAVVHFDFSAENSIHVVMSMDEDEGGDNGGGGEPTPPPPGKLALTTAPLSLKASESDIVRVVCPVDGTLQTVYGVIDGALATGDAEAELFVDEVPSVGGLYITESGSAAGDVFSAPAEDLNVTAGQVLELRTGGSNTADVTVTATFLIEY